MDKFRVISDLHMDVNEKYPFSVKKDGIFTVIAGDTCGSPYVIGQKSEIGVNVNFKCNDDGKLLNCVGKFSGKFELVYSKKDECWTCEGRKIDLSTAGVVNSHFVNDGDKVSFSVKSVEKWLRKSVSNGVIVAGNHIVYNNHHKTIETLKNELHERFEADDDITFLDNSVGIMSKEVDGILFVGSTLYTDYEYSVNTLIAGKSKENTINWNLQRAMPRFSGGGLNDFNLGKTSERAYEKKSLDNDSGTYYLTSRNYLNFFHRTFDELKRIVESNSDKPIVVVTHHCPSPRCISQTYVNDDLNASYVSDLEDFILSHGNIRCWCCGHVHHRNNFKVGNCRVVMNPLGYCKYGQFLGGGESEMDWSFNTFVNTKTWEVEVEPFETIGKWKRTYESEKRKSMRFFNKYGSAFIF